MVHDLLFNALLLLGILGFSASLRWVWRQRHAATSHATTRATKRPPAHKPFPGRIHKPSCATCEDGAQEQAQVPPAAPSPMVTRRGCPRTVDTQHHFCPSPHCAYYGWVGCGNVRANGHPNSGRWRQLQCVACRTYFLETHGTPLHGTRVAPELVVWAVSALAEGLGIRTAARVFEVDPNTVLRWLVEAADHLQTVSRHFLHDVHVTQVQLDELFALLSAVKDGEVVETDAIQRLSQSPHWVWVALDPVTKLMLTINVGERSLVMAQRVVHQVAQVLAPDCVPLFLTDGFKEYMTALLTHFGQWVQPARQCLRGPTPKRRWGPLPHLLYAQVVKQYRRHRLVRVRHHVVFGTLASVRQALASTGWQINTAFIERVNLSIRQHVAAVGRRVATLCKGETGVRQQLVLYHVYYNFCLPHVSLRLPLAQPWSTKGAGSAKRWQLRTPAMAAGLTDRVWTLREVLLYRVPPWPQPQTL
jgi:IS1 family transposase/transposase-like protein